MKFLKLFSFVLAIVLMPILATCADYSTRVKDVNSGASLPVADYDDALLQRRWDWDSGGLLLYSGVAAPGELSSSGTWRVYKYTYSDSDYASSPDTKTTAEGAWTDRTTLTYR